MPITIHVELMGALRAPSHERKFSVQLPENVTITDLLTNIGFKSHEIKYLIVSVNKVTQEDYDVAIVQDGDKVFVGMTVGGG